MDVLKLENEQVRHSRNVLDLYIWEVLDSNFSQATGYPD
jgi:hypothetical protein